MNWTAVNKDDEEVIKHFEADNLEDATPQAISWRTEIAADVVVFWEDTHSTYTFQVDCTVT